MSTTAPFRIEAKYLVPGDRIRVGRHELLIDTATLSGQRVLLTFVNRPDRTSDFGRETKVTVVEARTHLTHPAPPGRTPP